MLLHCGPTLPYARALRPAAALDAGGGGGRGLGRRRRRPPSGCCAAAGSRWPRPTSTPRWCRWPARSGRPSRCWWCTNRDGGTTAFAPINQGPGDVAWFGRDTDAAIARLRFLVDVAGPAIAEIIAPGRPAGRAAGRGPGHRHGRRRAHAHPGRDQPADPQLAAAHRGAARAGAGPVRRVPGRQPPVLPDPGHGRGEVAAAVGRAGRGIQHRHHDGPQRHHVRDQAGRLAALAHHRGAAGRRRRSTSPARGRRPAPGTSGTARCWS